MIFEYPKIFSFPPFFTRQLHEETWIRQRSIWKDIILNYYQSNNKTELDIDDIHMEPFHNAIINSIIAILWHLLSLSFLSLSYCHCIGSLSKEILEYILEFMIEEGRAYKCSSSKYLILWKTIEQWATSLYSKVNANLSIFRLMI